MNDIRTFANKRGKQMFLIKGKAILLFLTALVLVGCEQNINQSPNQNSQVATNTTNNNVAPANTGTNTANARNAGLPVTMPLIDAMFTDEAFAQEAKSAIQLSDEEITKIQDAARNAVLQLSGEASEDDARSTRSSVEKTRQEIEKIIGSERAAKFFDLIRNRWGGEDPNGITAQPNAIPTDTRVVVNAPAYRMDVFRDGQLVKTYKVGIGYPEFPLPTGLRKANEIIFNPTWTPPDEPWVKGKVQPGQKVEAGSKLNPLGPIKIPIGLPSLVHGGKDPSRLGTFASHGCVGLTNAGIQDFARELSALSGAEITAEEIKGYEKQKTETKNVKLAQPVPIELRYETIVVEDGKVTIYRDVYERGTNTEENLSRVLQVYGVSLESLSEQERRALTDALNKMAVDARGEKVEEPTNSNNNSNKNTSAKVTRNIKGEKSVTVEVAALRGKGFPAPVNLVEK
jgi:lipoprotein-anchoring transpeptidase ErfK/SrfK